MAPSTDVHIYTKDNRKRPRLNGPHRLHTIEWDSLSSPPAWLETKPKRNDRRAKIQRPEIFACCYRNQRDTRHAMQKYNTMSQKWESKEQQWASTIVCCYDSKANSRIVQCALASQVSWNSSVRERCSHSNKQQPVNWLQKIYFVHQQQNNHDGHVVV